MKFELEILDTQEEVRKKIQECEGKHMQQVAYSTFHDALTQVCYGCKKIRSNILKKGKRYLLDEIIIKELKKGEKEE